MEFYRTVPSACESVWTFVRSFVARTSVRGAAGDQGVRDGCSISEKLPPTIERTTRRQYRRCPFVAAHDQLEEVFSSGMREFAHPEIVGDEARDHRQFCEVVLAVRPPAIVYTATFDLAFAREIQRAGAFYDTADCLAVSLRTYPATPLPPPDRREPSSSVLRAFGNDACSRDVRCFRTNARTSP